MQNIFCRRWLFIITLLFCANISFSQALKKIEYFFDADPGTGNGTQILLTANPSSLDSTFAFNVSSLNNGLHFLFVRSQDTSNHWSLYFTKSFIKTNGSSTNGITLLSKIEYFFDTDPGVGNGKKINLNNSQLTDSTFNLDVSGLTNGLHIVYVRAADDAQNWSLYYNQSFAKTPGNDSALAINKLEYFVDTDPGFGKGIDIPVKATNVINDTFNFQIPDNGANTRNLYIRAQDSRGQWSLLYNDTINLCQLYKPRPNFSWVRFGDLYSFIDSTQNNATHKLLWNFDNLGVDSVSNPQFTFPQGRHSVTLRAGLSQGCRADSITLPLYVGLESYYPKTTMVGGDMSLIFYGGGLDTNVSVTLKNGPINIRPYASIAYQLKALGDIFDLHTATPGLYDINVHFKNGYDTTIIGGLNIVPLNSNNAIPEIVLTVTGPHVTRPYTTVTHHLIITNNGGFLAKSVPIWLASENALALNPAPQFKTFHIPDNQINYRDSIPTDVGTDSLFGEPFQGKIRNFIVPSLGAGERYVYTYSVTAGAEGETRYIDIWPSSPMYGSPFQWDCLHSVINTGLTLAGLVPGIGCATSFAGFAIDVTSGVLGQLGLNNDKAYNDPGNFAYGVLSAALGCIPGEKLAATAAKVSSYAIHSVNAANVIKAGGDIYQGNVAQFSNLDDNPCASVDDPFGKRVKYRIKDYVSADPNGISGPEGYNGDNNFVNGKGKQGYEVYFENKPIATANAQRVYIADTLDKNKFDLSTFELTGLSIADSFFNIPVQRIEYTTTIDLRPKMNLLLRYNAKLDTTTGILNTTFLSLDPITRDTLPLSDLRGFLPPDTNNLAGTGSISYSVNFKNSLATNDRVQNSASIIFDNNAAIFTNKWINTIDKTSPAGGIRSGRRLNDSTLTLNFGGTDAGVGIEKYKLYSSLNNNPYILLGYVTGDSVRFTGKLDSTYRFFAIPYDSVNNFLPKGTPAEYTVTLTRSAYVSSPTDYFRSVNSGVWNNAATWESSPDNINYYPATLTPDVNANTITIRNGHAVTVTANVTTDQTIVNPLGALIVTGSILTVTNNGLTLKSDATGTARIGNSTGTISGNVIAERFIPANGKRAWRLLSIPTTTSQSINAAWQNGQGQGIAGIADIGTMITSNNSNASFDYQTPGNSMLSYNTTTNSLTGVSNTSSSIATDNGYFLFVRGDRTATPLNSIISSTTLSTTGVLKQGNYPASPIGVSTNKFGLIGNPYASQIDFRNVTKGAGIDNTFYVWDPKLTGSFGVGAYQTLTLNNGAYIITPGGGSYGSAGSVMNTIESGQAFFVHSTLTDNISFTENAKSAGSTMVFRIGTDVPKSFITNLYSVDPAGDNLADGNMILLNDNYSNNVDGSDALKLENFGVNLGMIRNNKTLSVEKRISFSANDTVFFNLNNTKQQQYRFEFITNGIQQTGLSAWLVDKYLNTTTPVDLNGNTSVVFSITKDSSSAAANRFSIVFTKPFSVPVNDKSAIVIYPNPVINGFVKVQLNNQPKGNYLVKLLNSLGQIILSKQINHAEGTSTENIGLNGVKGIYMLEVIKPDNSKTISKLIIN